MRIIKIICAFAIAAVSVVCTRLNDLPVEVLRDIVSKVSPLESCAIKMANTALRSTMDRNSNYFKICLAYTKSNSLIDTYEKLARFCSVPALQELDEYIENPDGYLARLKDESIITGAVSVNCIPVLSFILESKSDFFLNSFALDAAIMANNTEMVNHILANYSFYNLSILSHLSDSDGRTSSEIFEIIAKKAVSNEKSRLEAFSYLISRGNQNMVKKILPKNLNNGEEFGKVMREAIMKSQVDIFCMLLNSRRLYREFTGFEMRLVIEEKKPEFLQIMIDETARNNCLKKNLYSKHPRTDLRNYKLTENDLKDILVDPVLSNAFLSTKNTLIDHYYAICAHLSTFSATIIEKIKSLENRNDETCMDNIMKNSNWPFLDAFIKANLLTEKIYSVPARYANGYEAFKVYEDNNIDLTLHDAILFRLSVKNDFLKNVLSVLNSNFKSFNMKNNDIFLVISKKPGDTNEIVETRQKIMIKLFDIVGWVSPFNFLLQHNYAAFISILIKAAVEWKKIRACEQILQAIVTGHYDQNVYRYIDSLKECGVTGKNAWEAVGRDGVPHAIKPLWNHGFRNELIIIESLLLAMKHKKWDTVMEFLMNGIGKDFSFPSKTGASEKKLYLIIFRLAVSQNQLEIMEKLLVEYYDTISSSVPAAYDMAIEKKNVEMFEILKKHNAPMPPSILNGNFLQMEKDSLSLPFLMKLNEHGFDLDSHDSRILRLASKKGQLDIVKYLIGNGISDVNAMNGDPLIYAIAAEHFEIVKYLLESGANACLRENAAIQMAAQLQNKSIIDLLMSHGVDPTKPGMSACQAAPQFFKRKQDDRGDDEEIKRPKLI